MTTAKNIAKSIATVATIIAAMGFMLMMLVLPAHAAYAMSSATCNEPGPTPEELDAEIAAILHSQRHQSATLQEVNLQVQNDWRGDTWYLDGTLHVQEPIAQKPVVAQAIVEDTDSTSVVAPTGLADIGRAEGIIVETEIDPMEEAMEHTAIDTTSEAQLALTIIAAFIPLTHFTKVALLNAYKNRKKRKDKAQRTMQPKGLPIRYAQGMQAPTYEIPLDYLSMPTPAQPVSRTQTPTPRTQSQVAMVFDVQPTRRPARRPVPQANSQAVRAPRTCSRRTMAMPVYAR